MDAENTLWVGNKAPDFELQDHHGNQFQLSDFKGKKVLLSFHPLAWTSVCAQQMKSLEEHKKQFEAVNTVAVGISIDTVPSKKAWAEHLGIQHVRLLSDFWPHGDIAQHYCLFRDADGISERANIIVDEDQKIAFIRIYEISHLPELDEIFRFLQGKEELVEA